VDLSYVDPHEYLRKPLIAAMRGDDLREAMADAVVEFFDPYIGSEVFAGAVYDVIANPDERVWNPADGLRNKVKGALSRLWEAVEPGTVTGGRRVTKGFTGRVEPWGRTYDPWVELGANVGGFRVQDLDPSQAITYHIGKFMKAQRSAAAILREAATNMGTVSDREMLSAYESAERARRASFEKMHNIARWVVKLGASEEDVIHQLDIRGLSRQDAERILEGQYEAWAPTGQWLEKTEAIASEAEPRPGRATKTDIQHRRDLIRREAEKRGATPRRSLRRPTLAEMLSR